MNDISAFNAELSIIKHPKILEIVLAGLEKAPPKFYTMSASSSGKYHAEDECAAGGLVLHTKRCVAMVTILATAYALTEYEIDLAIAAAIMHDIMKYGSGPELMNREAFAVHGPAFRTWWEKELYSIVPGSHEDQICNLIARHMGVWSPSGHKPGLPLEHCVHMADFIASRKPIAPSIPLTLAVVESNV